MDVKAPGVTALVDWFGGWPSFHDAEVLGLELSRSGPSRLRVYTFDMTLPVDSQGRYTLTKHVLVTFVLEGISDLHLEGFSAQNVIGGLSLAHTPDGLYQIVLGDCHGLAGVLAADQVRIEFEPGAPADSGGKKDA